MKKINQILLIVLLISTCTCGNRSSIVVESTPNNESTKYDSALFCANDIMIANFFKYKDEEHLFEGLGVEHLSPLDCEDLLIFNFEKGTAKKVKKDSKKYVYDDYIKEFAAGKTITGDFNGDEKKDTLIVNNLEWFLKQWKSVQCGDGYDVVDLHDSIKFDFSDKTIPVLEAALWFGGNECVAYMIKNEGDLDGDGGDEVGIIQDFYTGVGRGMYHLYAVFTLKNNEWVCLKAMDFSYEMLESGILPIEKDTEQKEVILIREPKYKRAHVPPNFLMDRLHVIEKSLKIK